MASEWEKQQFVRVIREALSAISALPECAHAPVIAQAAYESGWGFTPQAIQGANYWNLSAGSQEHGRSHSWPEPRPVMIGLDKEPDGKGGWAIVHQLWRVYDAPLQAVEDYLATLCWPRYQPARDALIQGQAETFIDLLGPDRSHQDPPIGGWYTLPTVKYLAGWKACLAEVLAQIGCDFQPEPH
jgi:flagellum-specific peptidoglycan hydrolase FlgJ